MKKFFTLVAAVLVSAAFLTSCLDNSLPDYPSAQQLNGVFGHSDVRGYRAMIIIKDSSAYFASIAASGPTTGLDCEVAGTFSYDQSTGFGSVSNGDTTVLISTLRGTADLFASLTYSVSPTDTVKFLDGGFGRLIPTSFIRGKWSCSGSGDILDITSLVGSKCGTLAVESAGVLDSAVVTGVSEFYFLSTDEEMGAISYQFKGEEERVATAIFSYRSPFSLELIDHEGDFYLNFDQYSRPKQ